MKDSTKKVISNTVVGAVGLYGLLAILMYLFPVWIPFVISLVAPMASFFLTIPVALVLGIVLVFGPLAILIVALVGAEWAMYRMLGLKSDW